jgi:hypothetical protein
MIQKKYFITYGSENFKFQKKHLANLVKNSEFFDEIISLGPKDLPNSFREKHADLLRVEKGGGYWIWKYEIIRNLLNEINSHDIIFYSSAGSSFNNNGLRRLKEYVDIINESDSGNLRFEIPVIEKNWTNKKIFEFFDVQNKPEIVDSKMLAANHFGLIKNDISETIFNEFHRLIEFDKKLITFEYDNYEQISTYQENRNDQSILSVLSKIYGTEKINDETYFKDCPKLQHDFPFLAVRKRKYTIYQKIIFFARFNKNFNNPIFFNSKKSFVSRVKYKLSKTVKNFLN